MRLFLTISLILFFIHAHSQMQVKVDSIMDRKGSMYWLRGKEMKTDSLVYFVMKFRGATHPPNAYFLKQWFTLYYPFPKKTKSGRKIFVTKNY